MSYTAGSSPGTVARSSSPATAVEPPNSLISSKRAAYRREHARAQHVDLEQAQRVEIVLVPLDDRAVGHRRILDGHQLIQAAARDDEAAHVLR